MKPNRNDPCPCGSGKKYKKCCGQASASNGAERAAANADDMVGQSASLTSAQTNRLVELFNAGRYADMENSARDLLEQSPNAGFGWKALSVALRVQGKPALRALQQASALLPDDAEIFNSLGNALRDLGQLDEALASYRRALETK